MTYDMDARRREETRQLNEAARADFRRRAEARASRLDRALEEMASSGPARSPEEVAKLKARLARLEAGAE